MYKYFLLMISINGVQATQTEWKQYINYQGEEGKTPLHHAVLESNNDEKYLCVIMWLIEQGADVNTQDHYGNTPLHYALEKQQQKSISLLLSHGADICIKNNQEISPADLLNITRLIH